MSRSRSFNRFHRYLARQKRHGLKAVLPQFRDQGETFCKPLNQTHGDLERLAKREIALELQDSEA